MRTHFEYRQAIARATADFAAAIIEKDETLAARHVKHSGLWAIAAARIATAPSAQEVAKIFATALSPVVKH